MGRMLWSGRISKINACVLVASLSSCGAPVKDERVVSNISLTTSESGGVFTGSFSAGSGMPQMMSVASGELSGSSLMIPSGALTVDLSISVASSASMANAAQVADLGISGVTLSSAGPAVNFMPSSDIELGQPMLLSIPFISSSLWLDDGFENLVVVYKAMSIKDGTKEILSGLIPRSDLIVGSGVVKFKTNRFGAFQVVRTSAKVESAIVKPSTDPIGVIPGVDLVGKWRGCFDRSETRGGTVDHWSEQTIYHFASDSAVTMKYEESERTSTSVSGCNPGGQITSPWLSVKVTARFSAGAYSSSITNLPAGATPARDIDFTVFSIAVTPMSIDAADWFNAPSGSGTGLCGYTDWSVNVPKSLSDLSCFDPGSPDALKVGEAGYDIFAFGNQSGKRLLYFGDDSSNSNERPTAFSSPPEPMEEY